MAEMTKKERFEAVVNGELPDRVPVHDVACIAMSKATGNIWKDLRFNVEASTKATLEYNKLSDSDFCFGMLETSSMFSDLGVDVSQPEDNYGNVGSFYFSSPEDIETKELYDPSDRSQSPLVHKGIIDKIQDYRKNKTSDQLTCGWSWGAFTTAGFLRGPENLLMDVLEDPDSAKKAVCKAAKLVDGLIREDSVGVDVIWIADPTSTGGMIDEAMFREFVLPETKKLVEGWKRDFGVPVMYHVCGDTMPIIDAVPETGIDIFSIDHAMNMAAARERVKDKICLMGNVDPITTLLNGTPEDVTRESKRIIEEGGADGRFILAGGCEVARDTPIENIQAMVSAAKNYRY